MFVGVVKNDHPSRQNRRQAHHRKIGNRRAGDWPRVGAEPSLAVEWNQITSTVLSAQVFGHLSRTTNTKDFARSARRSRVSPSSGTARTK